MIDIFKNFAGGNIRVRSVNGKNVSIEQEIRDTSEWWFYWCFGAETDEDGEYVFQFVNGDVIGPWGVALSFDRENWFYDKNLTFISRNSFKYPFQKGKKVYFSFSLPYTEKDFEKFLSGGVSIKNAFFVKRSAGATFFCTKRGTGGRKTCSSSRAPSCVRVCGFVCARRSDLAPYGKGQRDRPGLRAGYRAVRRSRRRGGRRSGQEPSPARP